ncbi:MAG: hypothetical protein ACOYX5_17145 [Actinomycetota bacterium]
MTVLDQEGTGLPVVEGDLAPGAGDRGGDLVLVELGAEEAERDEVTVGLAGAAHREVGADPGGEQLLAQSVLEDPANLGGRRRRVALDAAAKLPEAVEVHGSSIRRGAPHTCYRKVTRSPQIT